MAPDACAPPGEPPAAEADDPPPELLLPPEPDELLLLLPPLLAPPLLLLPPELWPSASFWAWIWGPLGLLLAVPMTVVLAVLGKHLPQFETLGILLGDEPALAAHVSFYQRLLAGDAEEAAVMLNEHLALHERAAVYDRLIVPALALAERDHDRGELDGADRILVWRHAAELLEQNAPEAIPSAGLHICVAGCAAQDTADELALTMLQQIVGPACELIVVPADAMASEKLAAIAHLAPQAVVISAMGPASAPHGRYLCKRLRHQAPRLPIVLGCWGDDGSRQRPIGNLSDCGASHVVTTFEKALAVIGRLEPIPLSA